MSSKILSVEIDGPRNEELFFHPLSKRIRGRIELSRMPTGYRLGNRFPMQIPGQRIELDLEKDTAAIVDGIHDDESTKNRIEKLGFSIGPKREELGKVDRPTFLFWLKRAVESGLAKVVSGKIPAIEGTPQTRFITEDVKNESQDRMIAAFEMQNKLMAALIEKLAK